MESSNLQLKRRYTRSDPRGVFPRLSGLPDVEHNRLAIFWRPIIDMVDRDMAAMRLRLIAPVSSWLADRETTHWSWFAMIGVAGLRHQVLRHAGLDHYDCREPTELDPRFRTPQWETLLESIGRFSALDYSKRALVVFQLAQLSYCQYVFKLAGIVVPNGDPAHDRYAYEVARVHARYPGHAPPALSVFESLATSAADAQLALASCAQGIGHSIRNGNAVERARRFEGYGRHIIDSGMPDEWHTSLVRSRFHRAVALLRLAEQQPEEMRLELEAATQFADQLFPDVTDVTDKLVALENKRILVESQIKAAAWVGYSDSAPRAADGESANEVRVLCEQLDGLDPYCIEARLVVADGYATVGDYAEAAMRYSRAGELGTVAGARGWFLAAQCYEHIGDRESALNAMGRCLELDASAIEAREFIEKASRQWQAA